MTNLVFLPENSCELSYKWDWKRYPDRKQEMYRFKRDYIPKDLGDSWGYGQEIIVSKNNIRGRGTALSLTLTSGPGKTAKIAGIAALYTGES